MTLEASASEVRAEAAFRELEMVLASVPLRAAALDFAEQYLGSAKDVASISIGLRDGRIVTIPLLPSWQLPEKGHQQ